MNARLATALLLLWSTPGLAAVVGYEVSATTSLTSRAPLPGDAATVLTSDFQLDPIAQGGLTWSSAALVLRYAPQLIIREWQLKPRVLPLHQASLLYSKRSERWSFSLRQDGAYGTADIGSLRLPAGSQPTGVYEVQTLGAVTYVRSASAFAFDARPTDRVALSLSGAYLVSGDPSGGLQLPLQHGPVGLATFRWVASRRFRLITTGQASHASFLTGAEQSIFLATESGEWQLARTTVLTVGAGAAVTRERVVELPNGPPPGFHLETLPVAVASLSAAPEPLGFPVQLTASLRMSPFADRFTGLVYERVEGRLGATSRPTSKVTATASVGGGYAVPLGRSPQAGDTAIFGEASATWAYTPWLSFLGTGRLVWTSQPRLGGAPTTLWALTLGAQFHDRDSTTW